MSENTNKLAENTSLAKKIAAGVIALSILVLGPVKLGNKRAEAVDVFKNGTETAYTASVYNDMRRAAEGANKLSALTGEEDLQTLARRLLDSSEPAEMLDLFYSLKLKADDVFAAYERTNPADIDTARTAYRSITSAYSTIGNDSYWRYAESFNSARGGFPAAFMAWYAGLGELPDKY